MVPYGFYALDCGRIAYNAIVQENAISIFPPIRVSTKRKFAHRLLKFSFPHLQQAVEESGHLSFVICSIYALSYVLHGLRPYFFYIGKSGNPFQFC